MKLMVLCLIIWASVVLMVSSKHIKHKKCNAGEKRQVDCLACTCEPDNTFWNCHTIKGCKSRPGNKQECIPGASYTTDGYCNTCLCNGDGTAGLCTMMLCGYYSRRQ